LLKINTKFLSYSASSCEQSLIFLTKISAKDLFKTPLHWRTYGDDKSVTQVHYTWRCTLRNCLEQSIAWWILL